MIVKNATNLPAAAAFGYTGKSGSDELCEFVCHWPWRSSRIIGLPWNAPSSS
jgi:hypothetical protein